MEIDLHVFNYFNIGYVPHGKGLLENKFIYLTSEQAMILKLKFPYIILHKYQHEEVQSLLQRISG